MNIQEVEKLKMDTLKEIADTNMKISEAKNTLFRLQEDETVYLEDREKKAIEKISLILEESKGILEQTQTNYEEVHKICQMVSSFTEFLTEGHKKFQDLLAEFSLRSNEWDKEVLRQKQEFESMARALKVQQTQIENDKKTIAQIFKRIEEENEHIESQRASIRSALKILEKKQNGK